MKYLDFHYKCLERGSLSPKNRSGLCGTFEKDKKFKLLEPTDYEVLMKEGYYSGHWGSGLKFGLVDRDLLRYGYTPLRQNIVLFMAAMNNEL